MKVWLRLKNSKCTILFTMKLHFGLDCGDSSVSIHFFFGVEHCNKRPTFLYILEKQEDLSLRICDFSLFFFSKRVGGTETPSLFTFSIFSNRCSLWIGMCWGQVLILEYFCAYCIPLILLKHLDRVDFYLLRTFCPHLGSFFCVVSSFTTFQPNFTSGLLQVILPWPRIGMMSLVTVFPVITAFHSCCLSHHLFNQINFWPAWVGFETAIFWQCTPGTVETQHLYPLRYGQDKDKKSVINKNNSQIKKPHLKMIQLKTILIEVWGASSSGFISQ